MIFLLNQSNIEKPGLEMDDYMNSGGLLFIGFKGEEEEGYNAVEGRHSLVVGAMTREGLVEAVRREVHGHFGGTYRGKVILREFTDTEIKLDG